MKRLFFAFEALANWPNPLPRGRLLKEEERHMTAAFIGATDWEKLESELPDLPLPPFTLGFCGLCQDILFLPPHHPRVVAYKAYFSPATQQSLADFASRLNQWLYEHAYLKKPETRPFLPHITLARSPFDYKKWKKIPTHWPVAFHRLKLYESLGELRYQPIWQKELTPPFEEREHTADIEFLIHGRDLPELFRHSAFALLSRFPEGGAFYRDQAPDSMDEIIFLLNDWIRQMDGEIGCPFKAVSWHGKIEEEGNLMKWEMIVDV